MKGLNPYMNQGLDIRLLPGSCPMDGYDYDIDDDDDTSESEGQTVYKIQGVYHIKEDGHYIPVWFTAENECIPIREMETSHIQNCIRRIYRKNGTWRHQYLRLFEYVIRKRRWEDRGPYLHTPEY